MDKCCIRGGFVKKSDNYNALSNICVSSGRRFSKDSFEIEPAMRETYVIILVTAGKGIFIIDGVKYPVKRGNSVMLFPFTSVKIVAYPNNIFEYKWVEITGFEIAVMISRTNFSKNRPIAPELPVDNFLQYFDVSDSSSETAYSICRTNGKVLIIVVLSAVLSEPKINRNKLCYAGKRLYRQKIS